MNEWTNEWNKMNELMKLNEWNKPNEWMNESTFTKWRSKFKKIEERNGIKNYSFFCTKNGAEIYTKTG